MRVNVLHHGACFDGAASSAMFAALYRTCFRPGADFRYIAKDHRPGDPYEDADFDADEVAVVDFRYTRRPGLTWFFDHHRSAFQLHGERAHFDAFRRDGRRFHDAQAPSCAALIAQLGQTRWGFDPTPHRDLLLWANRIDSADFSGPHEVVELSDPALRLMTFVEHNRDVELQQAFVEDLLRYPIRVHAQADYVTRALAPILERHRAHIELFRRRCEVRDGVVAFNLLDQPAQAYNKFLPYYHHPRARYVVGLGLGAGGRIRLSAGFNPWLPAHEREHDLADLCERFEGGGHAFVGGASFVPGEEADAVAAHSYITSVLRGSSSIPSHAST